VEAVRVAGRDEALAAYQKAYGSKALNILAFYNSAINMFIEGKNFLIQLEDLCLMLIPIDDQIVCNSFGVFESFGTLDFKFQGVRLHCSI